MLKITVNNWNKFNPRSDVKKPSWFRLEHDIFDMPEFTNFSGSELLAWVYILAMASRENKNGVVTIFPAHADKNRVKQTALNSAVKKLQSLGMVTVGDTATGSDVTPANVSVLYETRRDETGRDVENSKEFSCTDSAAPDSGAVVELMGNNDIEYFLGNVKKMTQSRWLDLYPPEYITREITKALLWLSNNPRKMPKTDRGKSQFVTNWLNRGWESYRKTIQTNQAAPQDDLMADLKEIRGRHGEND